ncbi:MAG: hypothetical protein QXU88_01550 [Candidatus Woesearchaeota archaeon]
MQKKSVLLGFVSVTLLTLLASIALASFEFNVDVAPEGAVIKMNDSAEFTLSVSHNSRNVESFEIYSPEVQWDIRTEPPGLLKVAPGEKGETKLVIRPVYISNPGYYYVVIHVRPIGRDILVRKAFVVGVLPAYQIPGEYSPSIKLSPSVEKLIDPRAESVVKLTVENLNRRELGQIAIRLRSNTINKDISSSLGPFERKSFDFKVFLDPLTPPQKDVLTATVFLQLPEGTYQIEAEPIPFEILAYGEITEQTDVSKGFLKTTKTITFINTGNSRQKKEFLEKKAFFKSWFTSFNEDYDRIKVVDRTNYYSWNIELGVGEKKVLIITTNYNPPAYLALAVIAGLLLYYLLRSPLVLVKSATILTAREGGVSEFKILLRVKNRSSRALKNVSILDSIPRIADIVRDFELGTTKPEKILRHESRGTMLKWRFSELEPSEERLITYRISSKLNIIGGVTLPVAVAKFEVRDGVERVTRSNAPVVGLM